MRGSSKINLLERYLNLLGLLGVLALFAATFTFQVLFHDLPCPLCLLQRVGFFGVALGFFMNVRFGLRPSHYTIVMLSALFTAFVALRQIALHIVPGTGVYGEPIFGLHLYSWSFLIAISILIIATIMLGVDRQYQSIQTRNKLLTWLMHFAFLLLFIIMSYNMASLYLECGFADCPDNPVQYLH